MALDPIRCLSRVQKKEISGWKSWTAFSYSEEKEKRSRRNCTIQERKRNRAPTIAVCFKIPLPHGLLSLSRSCLTSSSNSCLFLYKVIIKLNPLLFLKIANPLIKIIRLFRMFCLTLINNYTHKSIKFWSFCLDLLIIGNICFFVCFSIKMNLAYH